MRIGEECQYLTPCKWYVKYDKPCEGVLKDMRDRRLKKEVMKPYER